MLDIEREDMEDRLEELRERLEKAEASGASEEYLDGLEEEICELECELI